jgi:DNA-directed RNA polymerase specialized sigma24 family protein
LPDAEDAVQETLLRAWRHRDSLKEGVPLRPWLYLVATKRLPRKYVCGVVPSIVRNI